MLREVRRFFDEAGVLEVCVPTLGRCTVTDPNIESIAVPGYGHLQTSAEYFHKRLLCAGVGSLYQISPVFRAGERGRLHHPEFTMLEWYRVGLDDAALRDEVAALVDRLLGPAPYRSVRYAELLGGNTFASPLEESEAFARASAALEGRVFVTHYPAEQAVLAELEPEEPSVAGRFELVIDGIEIANGYRELRDAGVHRSRFERDQAQRRDLELPVPELDEAFLAAIESGLPRCAGVALGVDRLLMCRLGVDHIDAVLPFPLD